MPWLKVLAGLLALAAGVQASIQPDKIKRIHVVFSNHLVRNRQCAGQHIPNPTSAVARLMEAATRPRMHSTMLMYDVGCGIHRSGQ